MRRTFAGLLVCSLAVLAWVRLWRLRENHPRKTPIGSTDAAKSRFADLHESQSKPPLPGTGRTGGAAGTAELLASERSDGVENLVQILSTEESIERHFPTDAALKTHLLNAVDNANWSLIYSNLRVGSKLSARRHLLRTCLDLEDSANSRLVMSCIVRSLSEENLNIVLAEIPNIRSATLKSATIKAILADIRRWDPAAATIWEKEAARIEK